MKNRPTLLIVSHHFAPSPLVGAKRFSFLTREFSRQGFDVHVIANELRESPHGREDRSLPLHGTVHRVANPLELPFKSQPKGRVRGWRRLANALFSRLLAPVGFDYFWARAATRKALEVVGNLPADARHGVVIATSPPHAALIAGARIARRLRWPLVLDYRDPWTAYDWPQWHRGDLAQKLGRRIEARLVRRSAARVLNTPNMRQWFERSFAAAATARNFVIPNGFDAVARQAEPSPDGTLQIVHAGEIYGSRSLVPLLRAIQNLGRRHPSRRILLTNYGPLPAREKRRIQDAHLEEFIQERARVPFATLFAELQRAHVLLAVVSEHMTYSTPYKVYDYMAAGRPILALAPPEAALHDLLAESGAGESVEARDIAGIERVLEKMLFDPSPANAARIDRYRWVNLAQQYRAVIDTVAMTPEKSRHHAAAEAPADA
ncbi:MAG TPA: glycosyltransferase [Steroidobacteraceae bacterium]|jgi:glycosyltransferase involved in cell wall biosynthesis